jgi:glyoxylase-like metal-dependent hydrolase (beta-lactamase superfamily II)
MAKWQYTKGLHDLGNGSWAYLQPDGSWGWSNAGLVVDGDRTLLVDTLFDLKLTREMLATMAHAVPQAAKIDTLVNTHVNGDHTHGNQLFIGAEIVGTRQLLEEMEAFPPEQLAALFRNWRALGAAGEFLNETMGSRFDFDGVVNTPPTRLFDGELTLKVGDKEVRLVDLGPAHTPSDTVAYVPQDRTLFTGDLLFHGGHPAVWAGPVRNRPATMFDPDSIIDAQLRRPDLSTLGLARRFPRHARPARTPRTERSQRFGRGEGQLKQVYLSAQYLTRPHHGKLGRALSALFIDRLDL